MRALLVAALSCAACQPRTELVVGLMSDLTVPAQLVAVGLDARRDGVPVDRRGWPMPDGPLVLPGTYGLYSPDGRAIPLTIIVNGFRNTTQPIVARTVNVTLLEGKTLFVRMTLVQACVGVKCPADQNCVEGACVSQTVDARRLPAYRAEVAQTVACDSGTHYIDSSTGAPLPIGGGCPPGQLCQEGLCYLPPP